MTTLDFSDLKGLFSTEKKILLTSHSNPDGDAIGSILALCQFFELHGHKVFMAVPNHFPDFLDWMPGQEKILIYERHKKKVDSLFKKSDIIFALDYNGPARIGDAKEQFINSSAIKILIDHHIDPEKSAFDRVYSNINVSSTAELVFDLMHQLAPSLINESISSCIYTGIMTDTGSFSYGCNYEKTFRIVAELYKNGIDGVKINRLVYSTFSENRLRLLGYALSQKLTVLEEFATAYIVLTKKELDSFNYQVGDTEGLVNFALSIKGIKLAVLFSERQNKIRVSFRSAGNFSVRNFALNHFEGGGHLNASGGDSYEPIDKTIENFHRLLSKYKDAIVNS
ncbi:MAG: DHH family phosphoesterase [Bacteroidales bacterium]|nr:DHH family phosphoesterase [Bacteroidales bacterium]